MDADKTKLILQYGTLCDERVSKFDLEKLEKYTNKVKDKIKSKLQALDSGEYSTIVFKDNDKIKK